MASIKRNLAWQARVGSTKIREGSKKAAVTCWDDFMATNLIPVKLSFFLIMGASHCIGPFSTLFARALGLTITEVAIAHAIAPVLPLLAQPLARFIANTFESFKVFLLVTLTLSGLISLLNISIPLARLEDVTEVSNVSAELYCGKLFYLEPELDEECQVPHSLVALDELKATNCGYECTFPVVKYPRKLHERLKGLTFSATPNNVSTAYDCTINPDLYNGPQKCIMTAFDDETGEKLPEQTSFVMNSVVIDFSTLFSGYKSASVVNYSLTSAASYYFDCYKQRGIHIEDRNITTLSIGEGGVLDSSDDISHVACMFHCDVDIPRDKACHEEKEEAEQDVALTLWLFVTFKTLVSFTAGLSYSLYEIAVLSIVREFGYDYTLQRAYGYIGSMMVAPLCGLLIDVMPSDPLYHYQDFYISFGIFCLIKIICVLAIYAMKFGSRIPRMTSEHKVWSALATIPAMLLVFVILVAGVCHGFIETFQPWLLRDLSAPYWFIGTTTTVASVAALPFLVLSGTLCAKFGPVQCISFSLVCYTIRLLGYSFLTVYYWCVPMELLEGSTTGLLVASSIIYSSQVAPKMQLTFQAILATVHYGLGKCLGCLAGGYMIEELGTDVAFQIFSGLPFIVGFAYYLTFKLYLLPRQEKFNSHCREISKMEIKQVSLKDHRRNSQRYDRHLVIKPGESPPPPIPESKPLHSATSPRHPSWSDSEDESPRAHRHVPEENIYENIPRSPNSSTPRKTYPELPDYDMSKIESKGEERDSTKVTFMDETHE